MDSERERDGARPPERGPAAGPTGVSLLIDRLSDLGADVLRLALRTGGASLRVGEALLVPGQARLMREAGRSLRDLREVAGLTLTDLSAALDLEDKTLLKAVENGTATLSFELILRLSSLLARHDPLPFVLKYTRTYSPAVWRFLEAWGIGRLPLKFEREREFVNIYRRHDAARGLSDESFAEVLKFTRAAFEMSLQLAREGKQG